MLCTKKPLNAAFSADFALWNISNASLGSEELAHQEILGAMIRQLTDGLNAEELQKQGFADYYMDHAAGVYPQTGGGLPYNALSFAVKGDPITDLHEDLAAEQKARTTYENALRLAKDPAVIAPLRFLREREIVHYQRFGETLNHVLDHLNSKNYYAFNPAFDPKHS